MASKKQTTYTATVTETFQIGSRTVVLTRGDPIELNDNEAEILVANGHVVADGE